MLFILSYFDTSEILVFVTDCNNLNTQYELPVQFGNWTCAWEIVMNYMNLIKHINTFANTRL